MQELVVVLDKSPLLLASVLNFQGKFLLYELYFAYKDIVMELLLMQEWDPSVILLDISNHLPVSALVFQSKSVNTTYILTITFFSFDNQITDAGLRFVSECLRHHPSLTSLTFDFSEYIYQNLKNFSFIYRCCDITDTGMSYISDSLRYVPSLTKISLNFT